MKKNLLCATLAIAVGCSRPPPPTYNDFGDAITVEVGRSFGPTTEIVYLRHKDGTCTFRAQKIPAVTGEDAPRGRAEALGGGQLRPQFFDELVTALNSPAFQSLAIRYPPAGNDGDWVAFRRESGALAVTYSFWSPSGPSNLRNPEASDAVLRLAQKCFHEIGLPEDKEIGSPTMR